METPNRIIAIVGSARSEIMGDKEIAARNAAQDIGRELALSNWRIAVYGSSKDYIEYDVVIGYVAAQTKQPKSIQCYHPEGVEINFEAMQDNGEYFDIFTDTSQDWEVSFYRSISKADAILLIGGKDSAFVAAQVALTLDLPIIIAAYFPGRSQKVRQSLIQKSYIDENDINVMGRWNANSPKEFIESLNRQYEKRKKRLDGDKKEIQDLRDKERKLEGLLDRQEKDKKNTNVATGFLIVFFGFLVAGFIVKTEITWVYTLITLVGLAVAGGMGATMRMLLPNAPDSQRKWLVPVLGIAVGLIFSILYLLPQLIQGVNGGSSILITNSKDITGTMRVQYVSSLIIAFLAGLGFDFAWGRLIDKSRQEIGSIAEKNIV